MKKIIALVLSLAMLLSCAALAETAEKTSIGRVGVNNAFELTCTLPEGYEIAPYSEDADQLFVIIAKPDDEDAAAMVLSVAFEELYSDLERLNDADDETLAEIGATFTEDEQVTISYTETALGTKLMMVRDVLDDVDFVDFFTIYKGYSIEFVLLTKDANGLADEQIQAAVDFLSNLDFVPVEAE